jgi:cyclopropane-fatty-acyl-phospholipid synthase
VSHVLKVMSERSSSRSTPRTCARTTPARCGPGAPRWSSTLARARELTSRAVVRAYRLYLAGSAMSFERGWMALYQMLASRPDGDVDAGPMRGAQSSYPFNRSYIYE